MIFWIVLISLVMYFFALSSKNTEPAPVDESPQAETFSGYDCTDDCSGHKAGFRWAEEKGIVDEGDCDAAGDHSSASSFAEGCKAYINDSSETEDNDHDSSDDNQ